MDERGGSWGPGDEQASYVVREDAHLPWRAIALEALAMAVLLFPLMTVAQAVIPPPWAWPKAAQFAVFFSLMFPLVSVLGLLLRVALTRTCPEYEVGHGRLRAQESTWFDVTVPVQGICRLAWSSSGMLFGVAQAVPRLLVTVADRDGSRITELPPLKIWGRRRAEALAGLCAACGLPADGSPRAADADADAESAEGSARCLP